MTFICDCNLCLRDTGCNNNRSSTITRFPEVVLGQFPSSRVANSFTAFLVTHGQNSLRVFLVDCALINSFMAFSVKCVVNHWNYCRVYVFWLFHTASFYVQLLPLLLPLAYVPHFCLPSSCPVLSCGRRMAGVLRSFPFFFLNTFARVNHTLMRCNSLTCMPAIVPCPYVIGPMCCAILMSVHGLSASSTMACGACHCRTASVMMRTLFCLVLSRGRVWKTNFEALATFRWAVAIQSWPIAYRSVSSIQLFIITWAIRLLCLWMKLWTLSTLMCYGDIRRMA